MPALPVIATVAAVAGAGAAVVGTVGSIKAQNKAAAFNQKALGYQQGMNNLKAARERIQAVREARIAYGAAQQTGANQGASDTSAGIGGLGSIASQLSSNISFLDKYNIFADQAGEAIGQANRYQTKASNFGAVGNLGIQIFSAAQSFKKG